MPQEFFILETAVRKCRAEAQVNGIPLCRVSPDTTLLDSRPIHQYLIPGRNHFRLVVEPGPTPTQALTPAAEPMTPEPKTSASLRLMAMPRSAFPEDPGVRELLRVDWTPAAGQPVTTPVILEETIEIPFGRRWAWLDGESLEDAASLGGIATLLTVLHASFEQRDPEHFIARAQIRFQENSDAYDLDTAAEIASFREQFQSLTEEPGFQWHPISRGQMDLRVCAGGKMVQCVDRTWEPVLRSARKPNGSTRVRYGTFVARLDGKLQIVR